MKLILSTICLLSVVWGNAQTIVIVKKTKTGIYAGTDGRVEKLTTDSTGAPDTTYSEFCKIRKAGPFYFAVTDKFAEESIEHVLAAAATAKNFESLVSFYSNEFNLYLTNVLTDMWKEKSSEYNRNYPIDSAICTTLFFGFEADTAVLKAAVFKNRGVTETYTVGTSVSFVSDSIMAVGNVKEIRTAVRSPKTWKGEFKKVIYDLINKQIKLHPDAVAEPIHILKVTKAGFTWLLNGCE